MDLRTFWYYVTDFLLDIGLRQRRQCHQRFGLQQAVRALLAQARSGLRRAGAGQRRCSGRGEASSGRQVRQARCFGPAGGVALGQHCLLAAHLQAEVLLRHFGGHRHPRAVPQRLRTRQAQLRRRFSAAATAENVNFP